jgi:hypothetical protein
MMKVFAFITTLTFLTLTAILARDCQVRAKAANFLSVMKTRQNVKTLQKTHPVMREKNTVGEQACISYANMDFNGSDITSAFEVKSKDECCSLCSSSETRCQAWTFELASETCFLKSSSGL